ncbi:hypothetical protein THAOC_23750 [Thalassiosira oceanica]|uniref:Uncharacterized protein n=1 Tax=Thalassiosira oceanica TaxID=159749 RepID=K0RV92_THAOC|nr:hypothetical protein THAOC_23750 [Thalassiosira oceanica]|eukprot:EJK56374.1 hypothetical protein THAOC_23750 [Thalassiosira oceanica]
MNHIPFHLASGQQKVWATSMPLHSTVSLATSSAKSDPAGAEPAPLDSAVVGGRLLHGRGRGTARRDRLDLAAVPADLDVGQEGRAPDGSGASVSEVGHDPPDGGPEAAVGEGRSAGAGGAASAGGAGRAPGGYDSDHVPALLADRHVEHAVERVPLRARQRADVRLVEEVPPQDAEDVRDVGRYADPVADAELGRGRGTAARGGGTGPPSEGAPLGRTEGGSPGRRRGIGVAHGRLKCDGEYVRQFLCCTPMDKIRIRPA